MQAVEQSVAKRTHRNMFEALDAIIRRGPDRPFIKAYGGPTGLTRAAFAEMAGRMAGALKARFGDSFTAGILMGNCPEFYVTDMGVLLAGGLPVSLYPTASPEQQRYVIAHAGIVVMFADKAKLDSLFAATAVPSAVRLIVVVDEEGAPPLSTHCPIITLSQLLAESPGSVSVAEAAARAKPEDLMTIIYTSGTTGEPKGVQLSHRNFLVAAEGIGMAIGLEDGDRIIAWLPHAHVAERTCHYCAPIVFGLDVTICGDVKLLPEIIRVVEPNWFGAFPRVWEKLKLQIEAALAAHPDQEGLKSALATALGAVRTQSANSTLGLSGSAELEEIDKKYFAPLRKRVGLASVKFLTTGSAPTPKHVLEFFAAIGLNIGDMFGASETCMYGTMVPPSNIRKGSAGKALPDMELSISDDGEVLMRGPSIMQGYHNSPEQTAQAITSDGWYRTGDLGRLDGDGYLWITGRKKELIISSGGQNMSPSFIESMIKSGSNLMGHVLVIGDGRPFNVALVAIDTDQALAIRKKFSIPPDIDLARHPAVEAEISNGVASGNSRLARVEQIKRFTILSNEWLPGDELTPTLKLKRNRIMDKYSDTIERLYVDEVDKERLVVLAGN